VAKVQLILDAITLEEAVAVVVAVVLAALVVLVLVEGEHSIQRANPK